jgi:23S rRNA (guanine745-N1)-methyltransferase
MHYQCPLCFAPLNLVERSLSCSGGHQFDLAKEGYVNLMPAQHKRSKAPGDNKEMMQARRTFLESGHYQQLAEHVAKLATSLTPAKGRLLDIGCGEGYYTDQISNQLEDAECYGLDISKVAIRYAAKRFKACHFSVASSHRLPFGDSSLDTVVRIYAPCKPEELLRVLKPGGHLITVTPAARHLFQLRELIYDQVKLHQHTETLSGFDPLDCTQLDTLMALSSDEAAALLQMTPFAWKASEDTHHQLKQSELFSCEASFAIHTYQKPINQ